MTTVDQVYDSALGLAKTIQRFWNYTDLGKQRDNMGIAVKRYELNLKRFNKQASELEAQFNEQQKLNPEGKPTNIEILQVNRGGEVRKRSIPVTKNLNETVHQVILTDMANDFEAIASGVSKKLKAEIERRALQNPNKDKERETEMPPEHAWIKVAVKELDDYIVQHVEIADQPAEKHALLKIVVSSRLDMDNNREFDAVMQGAVQEKVAELRKATPKPGEGSEDFECLIDELTAVTEMENCIKRLYAVLKKECDTVRLEKIQVRLDSVVALRADIVERIEAEKERREQQKKTTEATMQEKKCEDDKAKTSPDETSDASHKKPDRHDLQKDKKPAIQEQEHKEEKARMSLAEITALNSNDPDKPNPVEHIRMVLEQPHFTLAMMREAEKEYLGDVDQELEERRNQVNREKIEIARVQEECEKTKKLVEDMRRQKEALIAEVTRIFNAEKRASQRVANLQEEMLSRSAYLEGTEERLIACQEAKADVIKMIEAVKKRRQEKEAEKRAAIATIQEKEQLAKLKTEIDVLKQERDAICAEHRAVVQHNVKLAGMDQFMKALVETIQKMKKEAAAGEEAQVSGDLWELESDAMEQKWSEKDPCENEAEEKQATMAKLLKYKELVKVGAKTAALHNRETAAELHTVKMAVVAKENKDLREAIQKENEEAAAKGAQVYTARHKEFFDNLEAKLVERFEKERREKEAAKEAAMARIRKEEEIDEMEDEYADPKQHKVKMTWEEQMKSAEEWIQKDPDGSEPESEAFRQLLKNNEALRNTFMECLKTANTSDSTKKARAVMTALAVFKPYGVINADEFAMEKSRQSLTTAATQVNASDEEKKSPSSTDHTNTADSVASSPNNTRAPVAKSPSSQPKQKTCGDHCHNVPTTSRDACCRSTQ